MAAKKKTTEQINLEAQQAVANAPQAPTPVGKGMVTQEQLDQLRAQGIDVMSPRILAQLSRQEKGAQQARVQGITDVAAFLQAKQNEQQRLQQIPEQPQQQSMIVQTDELGNQKLVPANVPTLTTPEQQATNARTQLVGATGATAAGALGLAAVGAGAVATAPTAATFTSNILKIGEGSKIANFIKTGVVAGVVGFGVKTATDEFFFGKDSQKFFDNSISDSKNVYMNVRKGGLTPEEAAIQLAGIEQNMNIAEQGLVWAAENNPLIKKNRAKYMDTLNSIEDGKNLVRARQNMIINWIAQGKPALSAEELNSLAEQ